MDSVPRLIPLYPNVALKQMFKQKNFHSEENIFPDYSGVGIDFVLSDGIVERKDLKVFVDQVKFGANCCALPFVPPNLAQHDQCLEVLEQERNDLIDFSTKFKFIKTTLNRHSSFKAAATSSYNKVKKIIAKRQSKDVLVYKSIIEMAEKYPPRFSIPEENYSFIGGSLTELADPQNSPVLLYSSGKKLNKLAITPLNETQSEFQAFQPLMTDMNVIKLKGGKILQIVSESCGICYVRQKHFVHFINVGNTSSYVIHLPTILSFKMKDEVSCISASPFIPIECAVMSETGILSIQNMEKMKPVWQSDFLTPVCHTGDDWWSCSFGSHPRAVLYLNRHHLCLSDARVKKFQQTVLLSSSNRCLLQDDCLTHIERLNSSPHQHLVTTKNCLLICDERYPNNLVMAWNHMLKSPPFYCKNIKYSALSDTSDSVVLVASQRSREICSFYIQSSQEVQPTSLSPPLYLSSPTDCLDSLKFHGVCTNKEMYKRLCSPLIGVCALPHSKKTGFTAFQLTSVGDLFFQDFKKCFTDSEKTYRADTGCVLCAPSKFETYLSQWLANIPHTKQKETPSKENKFSVDINDLFEVKHEVAEECKICNKDCGSETCTTQCTTCPSCGLNINYSEKLTDKTASLNLLSQNGSVENIDVEEESPFFNTTEFETFTDHMSKIMLEPWLQAEQEDGDRTFNLDDCSMASSFDSGVERPYSTTPSRDSDTQSTFFASDTISRPQSQNSQMLNMSLNEDDMIPPSQDVRPFIGETLRTPKKVRQRLSLSAQAGF